MVLFGVYIGIPADISGNICKQYALFSDIDEIRFIWMIYFLFTIALPVRGPVAERALFKRVKKHKKIQRHKRHVKM